MQALRVYPAGNQGTVRVKYEALALLRALGPCCVCVRFSPRPGPWLRLIWLIRLACLCEHVV